MSVENKPETVADPNASEEISSPESESGEETLADKTKVMGERMSEASKGIEDVSTLVPDDAEGSTEDVSTQGDASNDDPTKAVDLKELEASAGRKFESVDDFIKHYKNLHGRYGDQEINKAFKAADTLGNLENATGKTITEIEAIIAGAKETPAESEVQAPEVKAEPEVTPKETKPVEAKPKQPTPAKDEVAERLEKLEHLSQKNAFEAKYPKATFVQDEVAAIAKEKDISWIEAFESSSLKQLVDLKVKEESTKSPVVTPSNRVKVDYKNLENLGEKVMSGRASEKDQVEFAKEFFKSRGRDLK